MKAWDNSITTFPTAKFLDLTFKNWRNMKESGRQESKEIIIKVSSIKFLDDNLLKKVSTLELIRNIFKKRKIKYQKRE